MSTKENEQSLAELWNEKEAGEFFNIETPEDTDSFFEEINSKKVKTIKDEKKIEETGEEKTKKETEETANKKLEDEKKKKELEAEEKADFFEAKTNSTELQEDSFKTSFKFLKEKGFIETELEEDEITEENLEEIFETTLETRLEERIKDFVEKDLKGDEESKLFIEFKRKGGKTIDFLRAFQTEDFISDFSDEELETEEGQKEFLKNYYAEFESDMDRDDIEEKILFLEERGKLDITAKKFYEKLKEQDKKEKANLLKRQEAAINAQKDKQRLYKEDMKKVLSEVEVVGKIKITKIDKSELLDYLLTPTVKTEKGYITGFQKDLAEVYSDKKMLIAFAKIIKNKFNIEDLDSKTETVKNIKSGLRTGSKVTAKSLSDFF